MNSPQNYMPITCITHLPRENPLVYCATVREYWKLESKLGNKFHAGSEILKQTKQILI